MVDRGSDSIRTRTRLGTRGPRIGLRRRAYIVNQSIGQPSYLTISLREGVLDVRARLRFSLRRLLPLLVLLGPVAGMELPQLLKHLGR